MSDLPPTSGGGLDPLNPAPSPSMVRRRPATVQLRQEVGAAGTGGAAAGATDQSTQALGDALKVVYRLLQFGMVVLVVVFLLSGLNKIEEGQRGIRVAFGKDQADDLTPGFQLSLPKPLGDILKINTGNQNLTEDDMFWQQGSGPSRYADTNKLAQSGRSKLDPEQDGFLLTGDLSIGHVLVTVEYIRDPDKVAQFARRIHPDAERNIVLGSIRRGIVRAAASVTIEQFRKDSVMQAEAWRIAQSSLDKLEAGLQIRSFTITRKMVPAGLVNDFERVETSVADAAKAVSEAEQYRQTKLASTVGEAATEVLGLIDQYELLYTSGKKAEADAVLTHLDGLLSGTIPAETAKGKLIASGRATQVIETARADRASALSRAQGDASLYQAKLAAFKSNPGVVLLGDWADAYASFVNRDTVQVFMLPPSVTTLDLLLNRDPELQKDQEQKAAEIEQERIRKSNMEKLRNADLKPAQPAPTGG